MSYIKDKEIDKLFLGNTQMSKAYLEDTLVYRQLPYDSKIEYLKGNGKEYIKTDIRPNENIAIEIKWKNETNQNNKYLFGAGRDNTTCIRAYIGSSSYWRFGNQALSLNTSDTTIREAHFDKNSLIINDNVYTFHETNEFSSNNLISIFCNNSNTVSAISTRIYYFRAYSNNVLILNLIPVRKGNVGYMFDTISNELFSNAGDGNFTLGPDIQ